MATLFEYLPSILPSRVQATVFYLHVLVVYIKEWTIAALCLKRLANKTRDLNQLI